ncbi:MAG: TPM domain-containing protein [Streptococcaceae bacterium]|jgi:uncharacterized protein|nr:TPM domain-containing protein [Streptococcaceae bacterium]
MMKKKILMTFLLSILFFLPTITHGATGGIEDNAGLFSDTTTLEQQANQLAQKTKAGIYIVTTNGNSETPENFVRDYLRQKVGPDNNGIALLIDITNRDVYIRATGNMHIYITDSRVQSILDVVQPKLSNSDFQGGASSFFSEVEKYFEQGVPGNRDYTINPATGEITFQRSLQPMNILIAFIVALIIPIIFVVVTVSKYQLKLGTWKYPFRENGSIHLTSRQDTLTNSFVTTRRIPRNTNSGGSSGGGGGGFSGGGRKF